MSPAYLNPQHSSSIAFLDLKGDQQHSLHVSGHHVHDLATSYHNNFLLENHLASSESLTLNHSSLVQEKVEKMVLPHNHKQNDLSQVPSYASWSHNIGDGGGCSYNYPFDQREGDHKTEIVNNDPKRSKKWKPSKLKIVRNTTTTTSKNQGEHKIQYDHAQRGQSNVYRSIGNDNNGMRVCSDCHTTSTPLWRSGPQGPKSLCNACGIRQRKARRAAMAAVAAAASEAGSANNEVIVASSSSTSASSIVETPKPTIKEQMIKSERQLDHDYKSHTLPIKKRSKTIHIARNYNNFNTNNPLEGDKLVFDNFGLSTSNDLISASSQRGFPRDEEEGAILLMALSCGLACSS